MSREGNEWLYSAWFPRTGLTRERRCNFCQKTWKSVVSPDTLWRHTAVCQGGHGTAEECAEAKAKAREMMEARQNVAPERTSVRQKRRPAGLDGHVVSGGYKAARQTFDDTVELPDSASLNPQLVQDAADLLARIGIDDAAGGAARSRGERNRPMPSKQVSLDGMLAHACMQHSRARLIAPPFVAGTPPELNPLRLECCTRWRNCKMYPHHNRAQVPRLLPGVGTRARGNTQRTGDPGPSTSRPVAAPQAQQQRRPRKRWKMEMDNKSRHDELRVTRAARTWPAATAGWARLEGADASRAVLEAVTEDDSVFAESERHAGSVAGAVELLIGRPTMNIWRRLCHADDGHTAALRTVFDVEQRTAQWYRLRRFKLTASLFARALDIPGGPNDDAPRQNAFLETLRLRVSRGGRAASGVWR